MLHDGQSARGSYPTDVSSPIEDIWDTNCCNTSAAAQGGAIFSKALQMLPSAVSSGRGLVSITRSRLTNNTSGFGGALCCWHCRAEIKGSSIIGNYALYTLDEWYGYDKMLGNDKQRYVEGVGGAIAAVFDQHNSFVVVGNDTILEENAAQMLGGAVYMYAIDNDEKKCNVSAKNDVWDEVVEQYGVVEGPIRPCEVSFPSSMEGKNKAVMGGNVLAWTGQPVYKACCSSVDGSVMKCTEGPQGPPVCDAANSTQKAMLGTLPAQVLVYNTSCLDVMSPCSKTAALSAAGDSCWFAPAVDINITFDECLLGFSDAPAVVNSSYDYSRRSNMTLGRLYSGGQLNITAIVIDGYRKVMNVSNPTQDQLTGLVNSGSGRTDQPGHTAGAAQAAAVVVRSPELNLTQTDPGLFVIGDLTQPLGVTAQFWDLSLQPVQRPTNNANHNFSIIAGQESNMLRQVSEVCPVACAFSKRAHVLPWFLTVVIIQHTHSK